MEGEPEAVMDYYNALLADKQNQSIKQVMNNGKNSDGIRFWRWVMTAVNLLDDNKDVTEVSAVGRKAYFQVVWGGYQKIFLSWIVGYMIKDQTLN
ncbi:hypothetical protein ABC733_01860 [Mangrovibacter sp. SLW1]